jgi:predicted lipoprotein with Yx(FWY)xxD motif
MEKIRKFFIFLVILSLVLQLCLNQYNWSRNRNNNSRASRTYETDPSNPTNRRTTTYTSSTSPYYSTTSSTTTSPDGSSSTTYTSSSSSTRNRRFSRPTTSSTASGSTDIYTANSSGTRSGNGGNNSNRSTRTRTNIDRGSSVTESNRDNTAASSSTTPSVSPTDDSSNTSSTSSSSSSDTTSPSSASSSPSTNSTSSPTSFLDISQNSQNGNYLVNGDGFSLYVNVADGPGVITCYDDCIKRFIPTSIKLGSNLSINQKLDDNMVASIQRADGINQLTYNKYPLYLFLGDKDPGQINAQGMNNTWYLLNDKGKPINNSTDDDTSATSSSTDSYNPPALGPATIGLTLSASTSMLVVPDTFLLYFTILSKNSDFVSGLNDVEKKSEDLIAVIRKLNSSNSSAMTKVSLVDKKTFFRNQNCIFSYTYVTTTTEADMVDKITIIVNRLNKRNYNIFFTPEYTLSDKLLKNVKTFLYGMAVKTAMQNALEMTEKLNFEINKKRPIISIKVDSSGMQSYYPLFFKDTSSFYFLNKNKGVNVVTLKSAIDFNIKKK